MIKMFLFVPAVAVLLFLIGRAIWQSTPDERRKLHLNEQIGKLNKLDQMLSDDTRPRIKLSSHDDDRKYYLSIDYNSGDRSGQAARIFISKSDHSVTFRCGSITKVHSISDGRIEKVFLPYCARQVELALMRIDRVRDAKKVSVA